MLAEGNQVEIDTLPGQFTNFLHVTPTGSGDRIEPLPPDLWFPLIDSMFPRRDVAPVCGLPARTKLAARRLAA